tara:strand:+ start:490 stop:1365 length:876 start_codon:yes stop_codon:yes gene_type:complete
MENQTEQIRETSERIKGIMTSFGKQLKEISKKRKEQQKNNQLRLKRKNKITSLSSNISKSVNKIGGAIIRGGGNIFDKILTFASLILFGVLINNIGKIKKSIDEFIKKINKRLDPVKNFIIMLGNAAQRFVSIGKQKTQLNDDNLKNLKKETDEFKKTIDSVDTDKLINDFQGDNLKDDSEKQKVDEIEKIDSSGFNINQKVKDLDKVDPSEEKTDEEKPGNKVINFFRNLLGLDKNKKVKKELEKNNIDFDKTSNNKKDNFVKKTETFTNKRGRKQTKTIYIKQPVIVDP